MWTEVGFPRGKIAENVAAGQDSALDVVMKWMWYENTLGAMGNRAHVCIYLHEIWMKGRSSKGLQSEMVKCQSAQALRKTLGLLTGCNTQYSSIEDLWEIDPRAGQIRL